MKTSKLSAAALNQIIANIEGFEGDWLPDYSTDWASGGTIIEREEISISREFSSGRIEWAAWAPAPFRDDAEAFGYGETPLIAAMRCYVASKLGDEVQITEALK